MPSGNQIGRTGFTTSADPMLYDKVQKDKQRAHEANMQTQALKVRSQEAEKQRAHEGQMQEGSQEFSQQQQREAFTHDRGMQAERLRDSYEDRRFRERMAQEDRRFQKEFQEMDYARRDVEAERNEQYQERMADRHNKFMYDLEKLRSTRNLQNLKMVYELDQKSRLDPGKRELWKQRRQDILDQEEVDRKYVEGKRQEYQLFMDENADGFSKDPEHDTRNSWDLAVRKATRDKIGLWDFDKADMPELEKMIEDGTLTQEDLTQLHIILPMIEEAAQKSLGTGSDKYSRDMYRKKVSQIRRVKEALGTLTTSNNMKVKKIVSEAQDRASGDSKAKTYLRFDKEMEEMMEGVKPPSAEEIFDRVMREDPYMQQLQQEQSPDWVMGGRSPETPGLATDKDIGLTPPELDPEKMYMDPMGLGEPQPFGESLDLLDYLPHLKNLRPR